MPLTPTNMRVVDVARLLNSTSQGFVLAQARLYRQFNRVGFRIAATENTRNINLIKYIAWLCDERHTPAEEFVSTARSYEERKEAERQRNAALSAAGRDIAPLPEVVNPERKKACERNFQLFCESYFPETYSLGWSPDHIKAIEKIETAVLTGRTFVPGLKSDELEIFLIRPCFFRILPGRIPHDPMKLSGKMVRRFPSAQFRDFLDRYFRISEQRTGGIVDPLPENVFARTHPGCGMEDGKQFGTGKRKFRFQIGGMDRLGSVFVNPLQKPFYRVRILGFGIRPHERTQQGEQMQKIRGGLKIVLRGICGQQALNDLCRFAALPACYRQARQQPGKRIHAP